MVKVKSHLLVHELILIEDVLVPCAHHGVLSGQVHSGLAVNVCAVVTCQSSEDNISNPEYGTLYKIPITRKP